MVRDACSRSVAGRWRSSEGKSSHSVFDESSVCSRSEDFEKESELYSCVGEKGKRTERSGVSASNGTRSGRRDLEAWRNTSVHRHMMRASAVSIVGVRYACRRTLSITRVLVVFGGVFACFFFLVKAAVRPAA